MMRDQEKTPSARRIGDHWIWEDQDARTQIRLVGRGPETQLENVLSLLAGSPSRIARLRQVHSSIAIQASEGLCGEADALFTDQTDLAMGVATADCLPIVLSGRLQSAAVHAGWRGLQGGILRKTLGRMTESPEEMAAWIGPGIGVCCYEVGQDVARRVAASSSTEVVVRHHSGAVHLDLRQAARCQLSAAGIREIVDLPVCTFCDVERLWSYRREGPRAGRNWTLVWRTPSTGG